MPPQHDSEVDMAVELLAHLQAFMAELDPGHRSLLASLLAPGVAQAYEDNDVAGFDGGWSPQPLPSALAAALHRRPLDLSPPDPVERS